MKCRDCIKLYDKNSSCYNYEKKENKFCDQFIHKNSGLTINENEVLDHLVSAWNKFVELKQTHPSDMSDFADGIHKLQSILGIRILRRDYPKTWISKE